MQEADYTSKHLRFKNRCLASRMRVLHQSQNDLHTQQAALIAANARFEALAHIDALTGVLNHRATHSALDQEIARAPLSARIFRVVL